MKRTALALTLILALLASMMAGMQILEVAKANLWPAPAIYLEGLWSVYTNTSVPLNVRVLVPNGSPEIVCVLYCVDENSNVTLTNLNRTYNVWIGPGDALGSEFYAALILENLAEGNHTLKVYSQDASGGEMSASTEFTIDTHYKSPLLVLSPQNITYTTSEVPLTFVFSEEIDQAYYELDREGDLISGNFTLTGLSIGNHAIEINVWNGRKACFIQTVYFSVSSEPDYFPTTLIIATSVIIAVVGIGLFVYFKKRKREAEPS